MLTIKAYAKINLTLDILGKRTDGFHEISTIMQTIELHDILELTPQESGIEFVCDNPDIPGGEKNLAWQAADIFLREYRPNDGVKIRLAKRIPTAAGLAGGSSDAAAVLIGMNKIFSLNLSDEELCRLGAKIGSDVPFCILGGTMLAQGRGEKLTRLPDLPEMFVFVCKPPIDVSTAWAYRTYDEAPPPDVRPDNEAMQRELAVGNGRGVAKLLCNVFEPSLIGKYPLIGRIKQQCLECGAWGALMSGSGPTVFALSDDGAVTCKIADMQAHTDSDNFLTVTTTAKQR